MRRTALVTITLLATLAGSTLLAGAPAMGTTVPESHAPRIPGPVPTRPGAAAVRNWTSKNWSGYAVSGSSFTHATGRWTVPPVSPSKRRSALYSSTWVGIDGFNNNSLIQAGTEQDWINGAAFYQAWWEILPAPETPIASIAVHPGDSMSVSITQGSPNWTITVSDTTTGQTFTTFQAYAGPLTSAEWVQEAPTVNGRVAKLAPDSNVVFDFGTVNGASPGLTSADAGSMVRGRKQISTPSLPDTDVAADGFAVAYGGLAPPAPGS